MGDKTKIAIPLADGKLCAHFGHCEQFAIIETEDGEIRDKSMHVPPPHEPGVFPAWLAQLGCNLIIAGGMGGRAVQMFRQNGIQVVIGAGSAKPDDVVMAYLNGSLTTGSNLCDEPAFHGDRECDNHK